MPVDTFTVVTLVACAGQLALAVAAMLRGARSPLALPLALLCIDLFVWNFATLGGQWSGQPLWAHLDLAASPLTAPLTFHFTVIYAGRRRQWRPMIVAAYAFFGALSAVSLAGLFVLSAATFVRSPAWSLWFLGGALPLSIAGVWLLLSHARRVVSPDEQARTWLLLAAFSTLVVFGSTELFGGLGYAVPRLGNVATLVCAALMAVVAFKFNLFDRELSALTSVVAAVAGGTAVLVCLAALRWAGSGAGLTVASSAAAAFLLGAVSRQLMASAEARKRRTAQMATLGRYAAQMAHDLKNPLAALKGGTQFLLEELNQGRSLEQQRDFVKLLGEQVNRLAGVIDEYQRLGRMEPVFEPLALNDVVTRVLGLQGFAQNSVQVNTELAAGLPLVALDQGLLSGALENLLRNAFEAMPQGGTVTVRTELGQEAGRNGVVLGVDDTGPGMDPRTRESAFDDFFTTKAEGSGLGLAFVRRAVEAQGGAVSLETAVGRGCQFRLFFPLA